MMKPMASESVSTASERLLRLTSMLSKDPDNKALLSDCLLLAREERQFDLMLEITAQALARDPTDSYAIFEQASAYIGMRDLERALPLLTALTHQAEVPPAVWQNCGLCHYALENYPEAKLCLEAAYAQGEHSAGLFRLLISTLHHLGLVDEALVLAKAAADSGKDDSALAGVLALLYLDTDESMQAARWATRALALNPNSVDALVVQGTLRTGALDLHAARAHFAKALDLAPHTARAWVGLSLVSLAENDLVGAHGHIQHGLQHMTQHIGSWHVLAWIELMQGRLDQAETAFQRSMELNRNFAETHGGLAAIAALRGDRAQAEQLIEVAERLDAACLSSKFARSTLLRGGDPAAAKALLMTALSGLSLKDGGAISKVIADFTRK